jgi:propanediol dehydratase small subunit
MKAVLVLICMFSLSVLLLVPNGCATDQPGGTDTLGDYSTNVAAAPDKVTTAASKACDDLKFQNINASGTKVDGKVTAKTAQGDDVVITISQAGDSVSKVTVRVGSTGDQAVSKQIVDRINSHLSWF